MANPVDTGHKYKVPKTSRRLPGPSSERLMYVQFTSWVYGETWVGFLSLHSKTLFFKSFYSKANRKSIGFSKNGTRNF